MIRSDSPKRLMHTALAIILTAAVFLLVAGCDGHQTLPEAADAQGAIRVSDARIRAPAAGQDKTAAYLDLENLGTEPFVLAAVESAQARAIEIHTILHEGDMVRMRRLTEVVVAPGSRISFAPGGLHLMIFGLTASPEAFSATLIGADGRRLEVAFATLPVGGN